MPTNLSPRIEALPSFVGIPGATSLPFEVSIVQGETVAVNPYSTLLSSFNVSQTVPIFGLSYPFSITYGQKIYLTTYFDTNQTPVFSRIMSDSTWKTATSSVAIGIVSGNASSASQNVYPNEMQFITKSDLNSVVADLNNDVQTMGTYFSNEMNYLNGQLSSGIISNAQFNLLSASLSTLTMQFTQTMQPYVQNFSKFFVGASSTQPKLFKLFKMIAYTTKDFTSSLGGTLVVPTLPSGSGVSNAAFQSFNLVQCVTTDLMLVPTCYYNLPAKVAIPWTRPVYPFTLPDKNNEDYENYVEGVNS